MIALAPLGALLLAGCAATRGPVTGTAPGPVAALQIIAFNDFHGHIDADDQTVIPPGSPKGTEKVKAGGAANFAAAVAALRAENPASAVVTAGDMIGASPLSSGLFLDEPTIRIMNRIGIDYSALGNHEFDRGSKEILRMQAGGCAKYTLREPCQILPAFPGASFKFLAANTVREDGTTLFPAYGIKTLTVSGRSVRIGFVGMTLKGTGDLASPSGVAGLHFADEAETANKLVPALRAAGADILAVLIHEGGSVKFDVPDPGDCKYLTGDINPILQKLDPAFALVISGHTHQSYVCDYGKVDPSRPFLVSSAGQYGTLLTRITLDYDFGTKRLVGKHAENLVVTQSADSAAKQPEVADLVSRYDAGALAVRRRPVGKVGGPLTKTEEKSGESVLGDFIADAQLAAMSAPDKGGAQFGIMNPGGVRAAITPAADGTVTFGDLYAAQPFGNIVVTKALTGAQIRAALEKQFDQVDDLRLLSVSQSLRYSYDTTKPAGQRVFDITLNGQPMTDGATYHVAMSNFLANGGDGYPMFAPGAQLADGPSDLEALEAYVAGAAVRQPPVPTRIRNLTPE
ncbi:5'-nucleotidase C-terminal domain-containing protein [Sphingobium sp. H33]|uniref:5'-nucleotidase C-terminal domain-containing protein n=2 Tax=Sphingobium nicotianae TaxID=2782607 RepID=A0A9X1DC99_9SPHN|nr:5'-nucleotidase C-terminal domain-containing protein [Sphingobium nicotianae]